MKAPRGPFVLCHGRWYLDPTFAHRPTATLLKKTLKLLLERHAPEDLLILRPMTPSEVRFLNRCRDDMEAEAFATMAHTEEGRLGNSSLQTQPRKRKTP